MRHEDYKELLALEAAGALEEGERGALLEHLPSCEECRAELRELSDAAAALVYTVEPVRPPAELRANVLARVRGVGPSEARTADTSSAFVDPSEVAVDPSEAHAGSRLGESRNGGARRTSTSTSDARGLLSGFSLWQILTGRPSLGFGAAFASIVVVLLGVTSLLLWSQNRTLSAEVARLYDRLRETQGELSEQREQLASARDVNELLSAPGARFAELSGKKPAPQAHAMLAYDRATGRAVIMATGLPPCPAGHSYQLWLIAGDKNPMPGGTFKSDASGRAGMSDRLPVGVGQPTFAVTLEREGGVSAPEGEVFMAGSAS
ncbi:MAG TPA: anti-sigma factor [Pyrinomonadaceae bacterium]|nr:anti-sigma factor [Pyrinomonadaceae bacterium]